MDEEVLLRPPNNARVWFLNRMTQIDRLPLKRIAYALLATVMLASCGAQRVPFAVLVVATQDAEEIVAVKQVFEDFADRKQLMPSPPVRSPKEWPELKRQ